MVVVVVVMPVVCGDGDDMGVRHSTLYLRPIKNKQTQENTHTHHVGTYVVMLFLLSCVSLPVVVFYWSIVYTHTYGDLVLAV